FVIGELSQRRHQDCERAGAIFVDREEIARPFEIGDSLKHCPLRIHAAAPSLQTTVLTGAVRCSCTPPSLKRIPSASSAETTRCRARALALGTLPLDPSQAVKHGREIEARSASSCCERPVRLRAARNMPPVISTIVMLRLFARR